MRSDWRVKKVTAAEGKTVAELVRVEWFKKNPAYIEMMDEYEDLVRDVGGDEADHIIAERDAPWVEEWRSSTSRTGSTSSRARTSSWSSTRCS